MPAILFDGRTVAFKIDGDAIVTERGRIEFKILREEEGRLLVRIGNSVEEIVYSENGRGVQLYRGDAPWKFQVLSDRDLLLRSLAPEASSRRKHSEIKAPMPGLVVNIMAQEGENVRRGAKLLILEAMKMENEIRTPVDAVIYEILVRNGEVVEKDQVLLTLR